MNDFRVINDRKWTRQQKCEGQKKKRNGGSSGKKRARNFELERMQLFFARVGEKKSQHPD